MCKSSIIQGYNKNTKKYEDIKSNYGSLNISYPSLESSAIITRPSNTTAYTAGDVVGESPAKILTFLNCSNIAGGRIIIPQVNFEIDVNAVPSGMSIFRLHLYNNFPTAIADNSAFDLPSGDRDKYLGNIIINAPDDLGSTLWSNTLNIGFECRLATNSTTLYGILETLGAYTPTSGAVKKITLNISEV